MCSVTVPLYQIVKFTFTWKSTKGTLTGETDEKGETFPHIIGL